METAHDGKHKYIGVFTRDDGSVKHVPFGAQGMSDYTIHKNPMRRANYLARHRTTESWSSPETAGALSRWLLWGPSTSLRANLSAFKRRFSLE